MLKEYLEITARNHEKSRGVINIKTNRVIVPPMYENLFFFKEGIIAENKGYSSAYLYSGETIYQNANNILFVNDNYVVTSHENYLYLFDYKLHKYILPCTAEEILIFKSDSEQAFSFNGNMKTYELINEQKVSCFSIEDNLCLKYQGLWGVFNLKSNMFSANIAYTEIVQFNQNRIALRDANGNSYKLNANNNKDEEK